MKTLGTILLLTLFPFSFTWSSEQIVSVDLQKAYIPNGFQENEQAEIAVSGALRNSCYRKLKTVVSIDELQKKIYLTSQAIKSENEICLEVIRPFSEIIQLGTLESGHYQIYQNQKNFDQIEIQKSNSQQDHELYLPIEDTKTYVTPTGDLQVFLSGYYTSNCMSEKDIEVYIQKDVVQIFPLAQVEQKICTRKIVPFNKVITISGQEQHEKHLLHVKSFGGNSVNEMFVW